MAVENYTTTYSQPDHLDFKRRLLSDHARALALAGPIRLVKCIFVLAYKVQCTLHQDNPVLRLGMHLITNVTAHLTGLLCALHYVAQIRIGVAL